MGFAEARASYIEGGSALYRNAGLVNKAVSTLPRHVIFSGVMRIHAEHIFDPSAPVLTLTRLQKHSAEYCGISAGRVTAQVLLLRKLGFLETKISNDRRQRILEPTEKMLFADHRWLMSRLVPLGPFGLFDLTEEERTTPEFVLAFRAAWSVNAETIAAFNERHPMITFFILRDGGFSLLLELLREWQRTGSTRVAFDAMSTASAFCVSKSQVWSLLHGAQEQGFITAEAPAWRVINLNEHLLNSFDLWFQEMATGLAGLAMQARIFWSDHRQK